MLLRESASNWVQLAKTRLRMTLALRDPSPEESASPAELDHLVGLQLAHWRRQRPVAGAQAQRLLQDWQQRSVERFVFSIRGKRVTVWDKSGPAEPWRHDPVMRSSWNAARRRMLFYKTFVDVVVSRSRSDLDLDFALDVSDIAEQHAEWPVFGFQKAHGGSVVLLPDVDFFYEKWYRNAQDLLPYDDKSVQACFVGASTGGDLSLEDVQNNAWPRLRAAHHFHNSPEVVFKIAKAVQCTTDEARLLLQSKPYFSAHVD